MEPYHDTLYTIIQTMLTNDLTIGRTDQNLTPFTQHTNS